MKGARHIAGGNAHHQSAVGRAQRLLMLPLASAVSARRTQVLARRIGPVQFVSKVRGLGVDGAKQTLQHLFGLWKGFFQFSPQFRVRREMIAKGGRRPQ